MRNAWALWTVLIAAALMGSIDAPAQEARKVTISKTELQRLYMDFLKDEGYKPELDSDGDVQFKREGRLFFIECSDKDPEFFRVAMANIWPIESEKERVQVLAAANEANSKSKVAKVFTVKDNVWADIEIFVANPEDFKGIFKRAMSALDYGVHNFVSKMRQ